MTVIIDSHYDEVIYTSIEDKLAVAQIFEIRPPAHDLCEFRSGAWELGTK